MDRRNLLFTFKLPAPEGRQEYLFGTCQSEATGAYLFLIATNL